MDLGPVERLLRDRIGLDAATTGSGLLKRAVRSRMSAAGLDPNAVDQYVDQLGRCEKELQSLVEEVVVSETWFFRDEHPFKFLAATVAAPWKAEFDRPTLRVLSVPCATGEEPYSIAIALLDSGLKADRFRVTAVDVSLRAIEQARRGAYSENAFRTSDRAFRDRHFRKTSAGYEIDPKLKTSVNFVQGNVNDRDFLGGEAPFQAIFCRNLLIYLDTASRRQALASFERLLDPSGYLFLGHSETLGSLGQGFRPSGDAKTFAYTRRDGAAAVKRASQRTSPPPSKPKRSKPQPQPPRTAAVPAPKLTANEPPARAAPAAPETDLAAASKLADEGRYLEAVAVCEKSLRRSGPNPAAFFLLGIVRQAAGERKEAERCFEKAVYLDPGHEEGLLALALLAQRRGDQAAAANYRRRAERARGERSGR